MLSIIVPTYNESGNLEELASRLDKALKAAKIDYELLVLDDDSPDGTFTLAQKLAGRYPIVPVLRRGRPRGLSPAAAEGFALARGELLGCMDADLQHPPELIPGIVELLRREDLDIVVASRYVEGGGMERWNLWRRFISKAGILLARPLTPIVDCVSGFFFFKKSVLAGAELQPLGYKILLELLVKGNYRSAREYPYVFQERKEGVSKLGAQVKMEYLFHLARLYRAKFFGGAGRS